MGYVYVVTSEAMPGIVKIGMTSRDPFVRAKELEGTHSPSSYDVVFFVMTDKHKELEAAVHKRLSAARVKKGSFRSGVEWFKVTPEFAAALILEVGRETGACNDNSRLEYNVIEVSEFSNEIFNNELSELKGIISRKIEADTRTAKIDAVNKKYGTLKENMEKIAKTKEDFAAEYFFFFLIWMVITWYVMDLEDFTFGQFFWSSVFTYFSVSMYKVGNMCNEMHRTYLHRDIKKIEADRLAELDLVTGVARKKRD